jgi:hypothetical protein
MKEMLAYPVNTYWKIAIYDSSFKDWMIKSDFKYYDRKDKKYKPYPINDDLIRLKYYYVYKGISSSWWRVEVKQNVDF